MQIEQTIDELHKHTRDLPHAAEWHEIRALQANHAKQQVVQLRQAAEAERKRADAAEQRVRELESELDRLTDSPKKSE